MKRNRRLLLAELPNPISGWPSARLADANLPDSPRGSVALRARSGNAILSTPLLGARRRRLRSKTFFRKMRVLGSPIRNLCLLAILTLACRDVSSQAISSSGSGLISLPDTQIHPPGRFTVGLGIDNRDRDPLGLDLLDGYAFWTAGVTESVELYGRYVFSRVVALPEQPAQPPPPLDLIVRSGAAGPEGPFYSVNPSVPYVDGLGANRFGEFVPGGLVIGSKIRLRSGSGWQPALALAGEVALPTGNAYDDLRSGSGTGGVDLTARIAGEWNISDWDLVLGAGFTRTGAGEFGDRIVVVGAGSVELTEQKLRLPDILALGIGGRWRLGSRVAFVTELATDHPVGSGTPILDTTTPVDLLVGLQISFGAAQITAAALYHGNALESGALRRPSLAGGVVLSEVNPDDIRAFLESQGLGDAVGVLRTESQKVVAPPVSGVLPPGARRVPSEYSVRSEHQIGFVLLMGWSFEG